MAQIVLDVDVLQGVAGALTRTGERLARVSGQLGAAPAGAVGHHGLTTALDDFTEHWRHGLRAIGLATDCAGDRLGRALALYRAKERAIVEGMG